MFPFTGGVTQGNSVNSHAVACISLLKTLPEFENAFVVRKADGVCVCFGDGPCSEELNCCCYTFINDALSLAYQSPILSGVISSLAVENQHTLCSCRASMNTASFTEPFLYLAS